VLIRTCCLPLAEKMVNSTFRRSREVGRRREGVRDRGGREGEEGRASRLSRAGTSGLVVVVVVVMSILQPISDFSASGGGSSSTEPSVRRVHVCFFASGKRTNGRQASCSCTLATSVNCALPPLSCVRSSDTEMPRETGWRFPSGSVSRRSSRLGVKDAASISIPSPNSLLESWVRRKGAGVRQMSGSLFVLDLCIPRRGSSPCGGVGGKREVFCAGKEAHPRTPSPSTSRIRKDARGERRIVKGTRSIAPA
jgi:hypothetical protein